MKCIYCKNEIIELSEEHIILASFGSNLSSKKLICRDCNNFFSRSDSGDIDKKLSYQFDFFKNFLDIRNARGKNPPTLRNVQEIDGLKYSSLPGGKLSLSKVKRITKDNSSINIHTPNLESTKEQIKHLKRQFGDKLELSTAKSIKFYPDDKMKFTISFGGKEVLKAVNKALFNFIYYIKRDKSISIITNEDSLNDARCYIRFDTPSKNVYSSVDNVNISNNYLDNKTLCNRLYIFGDNSKKLLFGYYIVFGNISFSSVLSNTYDEDDFGFFYEESPFNKYKKFSPIGLDKHFSYEITKNFQKNFNLHSKEFHNRIGNLVRYYYDVSEKDVIDNLLKKSLKSALPNEGDIITKEHINNLSKQIAEYYLKHLYRLSSEEDITNIINKFIIEDDVET